MHILQKDIQLEIESMKRKETDEQSIKEEDSAIDPLESLIDKY